MVYCALALISYVAFGLIFCGRGLEYDAKSNGRGDELSITTDVNHDPPFATVVSLGRAWSWSSTALVTVTSSGLSYDLKWLDDDHAQVVIHVDEEGKMGQRLASVGPIQIAYSFNKDF